ncbi:AAA+ ATPase superfamily predicted ATPase [Sinorhizobium fredii]|nr:ATP-binding protein [Sinorhizobium fredii]MQW97475.1 ATP-binding protein [Sinorhizobium fredii]UTY46673.1 ATP-binding protein [Sinorhizobium fredii]
MKFVGRERELKALKSEFAANRAALVVAYGRRRIGKSRLLREAALGLPEIYFQATQSVSAINMEQIKIEIANVLDASPILDGINTWEAVFHYLADAARVKPGLILTLDEFPYLVSNDESLPSVLQRFWDSGKPQEGNLKLVLCGSAISQMEDLLAERNPLYGRKTMSLELRQMSLREVGAFFPSYSAEELFKTYATFGGVPHYLSLCDNDVDLRMNTVNLLLSPTGPLIDEPTNLLQSELREPGTYSSIIAAIAEGSLDLSRIGDRLKMSTTSLLPYLSKLERLHIVASVRSLDADPKARNRRFVLNDHLMRFWHNFVRSNLGAIVAGHGEAVYDHAISGGMSEFMGSAFESICLDYSSKHLGEILGVPASEAGSIWGHADFDIDIAGRTLDGSFFYGECKWKSKPFDLSMLMKLRERSELTKYGGGNESKHYLIFSKSGCTHDVARLSEHDPSVHMISLQEMAFATRRDVEATMSSS